MSIQAKIIPANVQHIENLGDTIYVSESNNGSGLKIYNIPLQGTNNLNFTTGLLNHCRGQTFHWNMSAGYDSVISTTNSYIKYTVQFSIPMANLGRYVMKNGFIYKTAITDNSGTDVYGETTCVCTAAMNALRILNSTTVNYGNTNATDELMNRWRGFNQFVLSPSYQDTMNKTWFDGDQPVFDHCVSPNNKLIANYKDSTGNYYVFRHDFILPLNVLNQVFDLDNNFYPSILSRQEVQFRVKLQNYSVAKLFGKVGVFDEATTGIGDIQLFIASKQSQSVQTKMNEKNKIIQPYIRYEQFPLEHSLDATQINYVNNGHNSSAKTALCIYQNDANEDDSSYLHGFWSTFTVDQLVANENLRIKNIPICTDTVFFSDYNVIRGTAVEALMNGFTISNLYQLYQETLRSINKTQQFSFGLSNGGTTIYNWLSKYAFVISSLEMFSMDEVTDVVGDGYYSLMQKIMMKYCLSPYINQQVVKADSTVKGLLPQCKTVTVEVYQFFDQFVSIDISTGQIIITENLEKKE
ncbi:Conserved_hypothetical protein [Hexamita inflata]|uniref:Uncharacterized protein n=2 Tax=Hexamita inflata TaxID=28002 RepID=A0AA86Q772_9EUKA|nr:Conserved hypothetical protein [Hexamita inflata]